MGPPIADAETGLLFAAYLDGRGGATSIEWADIKKWSHEKGVMWVHLDYTRQDARKWLESESELAPVIVESLVAEETRPRALPIDDGLVLFLRGVNMNPGAEPHDMVSLRMYIDPHWIVTLRHRRLLALQDIRTAFETGKGPVDAGTFLSEVTDRLVDRIGDTIDEVHDQVDRTEESVLTTGSSELRGVVAGIRREVIGLRRYLAPQRDALIRLLTEKVSWLAEPQRVHIRELADRLTRYVEDLDAVRDRAAVTQEELNNRISDQMNRTMYVLSIVAAIFLPLGLITGLLGINVGGIPGSNDDNAFLVVCGILVALAIALVFFFRWQRRL